MEKYLCISELIFRFLCAFCVHVYDFVSIIIPGNTVHKEHKPINPTLPTNVGGILLHALDDKKYFVLFFLQVVLKNLYALHCLSNIILQVLHKKLPFDFYSYFFAH